VRLSIEFSFAAIMALILYFAAAKSNAILNVLLLIALFGFCLHPSLSLPWVMAAQPPAIRGWRILVVVCVVLIAVVRFGIWVWPSQPLHEEAALEQQTASTVSPSPDNMQKPDVASGRPIPQETIGASQKDADADSERYIPWGNQQVTIIGSGFGNLPDVKAGRISNSLLDSGITGSIRIVYVGAFHPELADELFAEFQRGGWKPETLQVDLILEKHAQESLYLLSPDLSGKKARAAIDALGRADLSIPEYTGKPTVGPTPIGIPDVTIVIKQQ
jgi:hypothetical protein